MARKKNDTSPSRRGRPPAYDAETALKRATEAFWRTGYSGTSLDKVAAVTGMSPPSLYAVFGNKHALYLEALAHYWETSLAATREALAGDHPLDEALMLAYEAALSIYFSGRGTTRGCFVVGTAVTEVAEPPPGPAVTAVTPAPEPEPKRKGGVSWKVLLTVALVMAVGGTAGGVVLMKKLDDGKKPAASSTPAPAVTVTQTSEPLPPAPAPARSSDPSASSASPTPTKGGASSPVSTPSPVKYVAVYENRDLTAPSHSYSFDLNAGKVSPDSGGAWGMTPSSSDFSWSNADPYISRGSTLTPEQCSAAIDQEPAADLKYADLPPGRLFCLRHRTTGSIIIGKVIEIDTNAGSAKLTLSLYRKDY